MTRFSLVPLLGLALAPSAEATQWRSTSGLLERTKLIDTLTALDGADTPIDAWEVDAGGDWIVIAGGTVYNSAGFDANVVTSAKLNLVFGRDIWGVDCAASGTCVLVHSMGQYSNGALPAAFSSEITDWVNDGHVVRDVEYTGTGWMLLGEDGDVASSGLAGDLQAALDDRYVTGRTIRDVAIGPDGDWMLVADQNPMYDVDSSSARSSLKSATRTGHTLDRLLYGPGDTFVLYNGDDDLFTHDPTDAFETVEHDLGGGANLWQRMADYGVVGVSIAIIENNQVVASRGYGYRRVGFEDPILGDTPFDLASLSKYVGALTTLAVLEDDAGLDLGTDVLDVATPGGAVETWNDRGETDPASYGFSPGIGALPDGLTYRRLLSNTGAMRTEGSPGVPWINVDPTIPTEDWMSGYVCDLGGCDWDTADDYVWTDATLGDPGDAYNYSGPGFFLAQASLEDRTGMSGAQLMEQHLFDPLGLDDITGEIDLSADFVARAAQPHGPSGQQQAMVYPWTFAGGVHASAGDYAELVILGLNEGRSSGGRTILAASSIQALLTGQTLNSGAKSAYGFGVDMDCITTSGSVCTAAAVTETNDEGFFHSGGHPGFASTYMCGIPEDDVGIVILFNTDDNGAGPDVSGLRNEILTAFQGAEGFSENCR
jgi:CubicO group peptidase (beta-lactamase class C family)